MSKPVTSKQSQDVRKQATNQRPSPTSRSPTRVSRSPSQPNISDLMRYALGYPTFEPLEHMGLHNGPEDRNKAVTHRSAAMGSIQPTRSVAIQKTPPGKRISSAGAVARPGHSQTRVVRGQTAANGYAVTSSSGATNASSKNSTDTPYSSSSVSSSPLDSESIGVNLTGKVRTGRDSGSGTKNPDRIVCWR